MNERDDVRGGNNGEEEKKTNEITLGIKKKTTTYTHEITLPNLTINYMASV